MSWRHQKTEKLSGFLSLSQTIVKFVARTNLTLLEVVFIMLIKLVYSHRLKWRLPIEKS